ncbi:hypothetical protein [Dysgonomonas termitidis]|uniref:Uncharacterized protein n=1 Tax=Dysgonomonas termitidis TaxID=1516126 RepID=A0ABV9KQ70_9BACT
MILENAIKEIANFYKADYNYLLAVTELCRLKGVLTKHELMQFDNNGIPMSIVLKSILSISSVDGLKVLLENNKISFSDISCILGIIAQDAKLQLQKRKI